MSETPAVYNYTRRRGQHENSLATYHGKKGVWTGRCAQILESVMKLGPGTPRQIRDRLGYRDMNAVQPRITEMIDRGELVELEGMTDPETGIKMRVVGFPREPWRPAPRPAAETPKMQLELDLA